MWTQVRFDSKLHFFFFVLSSRLPEFTLMSNHNLLLYLHKTSFLFCFFVQLHSSCVNPSMGTLTTETRGLLFHPTQEMDPTVKADDCARGYVHASYS